MKDAMANIDFSDSPYGDLQGSSKAQHVAYDDGDDIPRCDHAENKNHLLNSTKLDTFSAGGSELATAIDDILSCCDPGSTQAQILKSMTTRMHQKGRILDEEKQELFSDESMTDSVRSLYTSSKRTAGKRDKVLVRSYRLAAVVFLLAVLIITGSVILAISSLSRDDSLAPVRIGPYSENYDCSLITEQDQPNVLSQCACQGSISVISDKVKDKYDTLLQAFGAEYLQPNERPESCSARNQALVWLAEDEGSTLSNALIQRHTLVLFFLKLNGLEWTLGNDHRKWLTPDHECTWHGVTCDENKRVTALDLWNLNLDGSLPKELMSLTSLERLALPENKIIGHLPVEAFVMMSKLTDLTLFMNSFSGSIDGKIFDSINHLRTLNVDSNDLTGPIPTEVGQLSNLMELKLARNYLKGALPTELGKLSVLTKMELEENNIEGTLPSEIGQLFKLEYLDLSWNNLQGGSIPWEFQELRNLKELFLKSNDLGGSLPTILNVMSNLENLVLSLNAFTGSLPSMARMSSLATLHLDGNRLTGKIPSELGVCSMLRDIRLDFNSFTGELPSEIGELEWLVSLNLGGTNSLTGTMPQAVCNLRGNQGSLETLSAACAAETESMNRQEAFGKSNELVCSVPDCCTSCEL